MIRANVAAYVAAYSKKDAKALAEFWSEDGKFVSPLSGEVTSGRENIEREYAAMFADVGEASLDVKVDSLRFITADVAVEEGSAEVIYPGELPSESRYQVIHIRRDGKWLIDSIRETVEAAVAAAAADSEQVAGVAEMAELAWMIGDWIDEGDRSAIYHSCSWGMGKSFIKREFTITMGDDIAMNGIEVVGWDPADKTYRSWVFDSEGGFGSAVWTREGENWTKRLTGTTKTGQKAFATNTIIKVDDNSYQWRAHGRVLDGEILPNIDIVTVVRTTEGE